jgi:hypothetical protein
MLLIRILLLLALLLPWASCTERPIQQFSRVMSDGRYDSEFPSQNSSREIATIAGSVMKLYSIARYTTYQFTREIHVTRHVIQSGSFRRLAFGVISTSETTFGTATILFRDENRIALLTCAHLVNAPDTLYSWHDPVSHDPGQYVRSIAIKERQEHYIRELASCGSFGILAIDSGLDVALIGRTCDGLKEEVKPFPYALGAATQLEWGCFVYVMGYPLGIPVVTKGIVSAPNNTPRGGFTIDALLNKGFSGGIILAIRDGIPNFELVGIVRSIASEREYYLKPEDPFGTREYSPHIPFRGDPYVETREFITYGVNYIVPIEVIRDFYRENREIMINSGYNLDAIILQP